MSRWNIGAVVTVLYIVAFAQDGRSQSPRPAFEVVSIREHKETNGPPVWLPQRSGDRVTLRMVRPDVVIDYAWHIVSLYQVSFPSNMPLDWYDIEARTDGVPTDDQLRLMFQTLLEDRFKLKVHWETREIPQYDLVVSKAGKLKPADPQSVISAEGIRVRPGTASIPIFKDGPHLMGEGVAMDQIVDVLSRHLRAPVRDMTGLAGTFDFNILLDRPDDSSDAVTTAALQEAVQRELGLKLEKGKGPVQVLVVDNVEKPTRN